MRRALDNLKHMEEENENFIVKCYDLKFRLKGSV